MVGRDEVYMFRAIKERLLYLIFSKNKINVVRWHAAFVQYFLVFQVSVW